MARFREWMRDELPYGVWITDDQRVVLFNRGYRPIWQRAADGTLSAADHQEWIKQIREQHYLYDDSDPPRLCEATRQRCEAFLEAFLKTGLPDCTIEGYRIVAWRAHRVKAHPVSAPS